MTHIVKRRGHKQEFDERKVYASTYAACLSSHIPHLEAERIASEVTKSVMIWIKDKHEVASYDLFKKIGELLIDHHKDAAFMYLTHRDVS